MSNLNDGGVAWNHYNNSILEVIIGGSFGGRLLCPLYFPEGAISYKRTYVLKRRAQQ